MLSLAQRGETGLELFPLDQGTNENPEPVEVFQGHSDVALEFVWRKVFTGMDGSFT